MQLTGTPFAQKKAVENILAQSYRHAAQNNSGLAVWGSTILPHSLQASALFITTLQIQDKQMAFANNPAKPDPKSSKHFTRPFIADEVHLTG